MKVSKDPPDPPLEIPQIPLPDAHLDHKALALNLPPLLRLEKLPNRKHRAAPRGRLAPQRTMQPDGLRRAGRGVGGGGRGAGQGWGWARGAVTVLQCGAVADGLGASAAA